MATVIDNRTQDSSLHVGVSTNALDPSFVPTSSPRRRAGAGARCRSRGEPAPLLFPTVHSAGATLASGATLLADARHAHEHVRRAARSPRSNTWTPRADPTRTRQFGVGLSPGGVFSFEDVLEERLGILPGQNAYGAMQISAAKNNDGTWASGWADVDVQTETYTVDPVQGVGDYKTGMEGYAYFHGYSSFQSNLGTMSFDGAENSTSYRTNLILHEVGGAYCDVIVSAYMPGSFVPVASVTTVRLAPIRLLLRRALHERPRPEPHRRHGRARRREADRRRRRLPRLRLEDRPRERRPRERLPAPRRRRHGPLTGSLAGAVERIAHYRILKRIGRGGMGIVYQAVDERDGRLVALKVIREAEAPGDESAVHQHEARVRFDREAAILKSLLHVNVVTFYEIGEEDGTPWLAMEYLDGVPLTSYSGKPWTETLPLLVQAAHGMEYLASRGIVHRDLSPDNILVIERGGDLIVKLLDFGIAKLFEHATGLESLTATGFFLGKVAYGSPEQLGALGHGATLDWRSDVYSLGVIFYQVLAGQRPFDGKAPVEYIAAHLNATAPPVAAPHDAPALPVPLVRLIGQMLEKRREDRPGGWREIVDRLVGVLRATGSTARLPESVDHPASPGAGDGDRTDRARRPDADDAAAARTGGTGRACSRASSRDPSSSSWRRRGTPAAFTQATDPPPPRPKLAATRPAPPPPPAASAAANTGRLRILALPYARVLSVVSASGKAVALPKDATTPVLLRDLAPGTYRVVLARPDGTRRVERRVEVAAGAVELLSEPFDTPSSLAQLLRTGGSKP